MKLGMFLLAVCTTSACHHEKQLATIRLEWRGGDGKVGYKDSVLKAIASKRLALAVVDTRRDRSVGHYHAKNGGDHTVNASQDVVAFTSSVLNDRFNAIGVPFVTAGQAFTLRTELQDFNVVETDEYHAQVTMRFVLVGADGQEAWSHSFVAKTSHGGQDHSEDNYNENLTEAFDGVMKQLLTSPDFESGITGQPIAQPDVVLPPPKLPKGPVLHLAWRGADPTRKAGADATLSALRAVPIHLVPLVDSRTEILAIGRYENDKNATVYTPDNVAKFYGKVLAERFRTLGVQLVDTGATFELAAELLELSVVEGDKFHGTARMRVTLVKQGAVVWNGVFEGTSERWGKTHSQGLLNEALSIAYDDTLHNALSSAELAAALK